MGGKMGRLGAIDLCAGNVANRVNGIGKVQHMVFTVRPKALVVCSGGPQEEISSPQCSQVEVEFALGVDEQRAAPLLLQHLLAVGALEAEVLNEVFEIAAVGVRAEAGPAFQAGQGQL